MPRTTNFVLNQEQENRLTQFIDNKYEALKQDNLERLVLDAQAWKRYNLEVKERDSLNQEIYSLSNIPVPVYAMIMEHFVSRSEDSTTGDKPYFHFDAVGGSQDRAMAYDRYFNWKLDEMGRVHESLQDDQLPTFIQCASFLKAVFKRETIGWIDHDKQVLHDRNTRQPIEILNHGPIIKDEDGFTPQLDPVGGIRGAFGAKPEERLHLNADPTFVMDESKHYWDKPPAGLKRTENIYTGAKSENIPYDRMLAPMDAESFDAADTVIEIQDRDFNWFQNNWIERPFLRWADFVGKFSIGDTTSKAAKDSPTQSTQTGTVTPVANDTVNPVRKVYECWIRRDVMGNGTLPPQDFVCWYDVETKVLVYYEWLAKVCPDMKRPYTVTAIRKMPKRWWGKSIWQVGKPIFESIDRLFNGEFFRAIQQANPPKGGDPNAAVEEPRDIGADPTKYWELKKGRNIKELLEYATVPDTNARSQMILEYLVYWLQLWLGISNLAQGDYQAVNTNATKYGIQKTLAESSMLGRRWIRRLISSWEEHITKLVLITVQTLPQNQKETYEYTEGDQRKSALIQAIDIKQLTIHVSIVMGQNQEEKDIERAKTALDVQEKYFGQINPQVRLVMRPLLVEILGDLGYDNPEDLLPITAALPVDPAMLGGGEGQLHKAVAVAAGAADPNSGVPIPQPPEAGGKK